MSDRLMFWDEGAMNAYTATDRLDEQARESQRQSLWNKGSGGWAGHIGFGDAHVEWRQSSILDVTSYDGRYTEGNNIVANSGNGAPLDRGGDSLFTINSGFTNRTQDAAMVVGWGSQTFQFGNARNIRTGR